MQFLCGYSEEVNSSLMHFYPKEGLFQDLSSPEFVSNKVVDRAQNLSLLKLLIGPSSGF